MKVTTNNQLTVLFLTVARNQASYRYRVAQFMPYWSTYGIHARELCVVGTHILSELRIALSASSYDYVILQKKLLPSFLVTLIAKRSRLVYDFDDALYAREPYLSAPPRPTQPGSRATLARLRHVLTNAHIVFAGNRTLVQYASRFASRVFVVPTALIAPTPRSQPPTAPGILRIGWIGNARNLYYLKEQDGVFARLQEENPRLRFCCMSSAPPENTRTRWAFTPWSISAEPAWFESIDVGIMPLTKDPWSEGKCAFKLLQFMAHGCAVVGSAVGANCDVIEQGVNGYLTTGDHEWHDALRRLAAEPGLVGQMGLLSRDRFLSTYERGRVQERIVGLLMSAR
jgi:glycosyltransferase involved in cell wall biosynthesis